MINPLVYMALVGFSLLASSAQLCLKGAIRKRRQRRLAVILLAFTVCLMGFNYLLYTWALRVAPLGIAQPFAALSFIFTPLGAILLYHEKVRFTFWPGVLLIVLGVCICA